MRTIKLIWDFRGPAALQTAKHHEIHLKEYITVEKITVSATGIQEVSEMHAIAFIAVSENNMIALRDALKPHRGEVYEQN